MKIGFFDSGIGGLTVLNRAMKEMCGEFIYYADTDNVPYGEKTKDEIRGFSDRAVDFLANQGAEIIVIACNTATSAAAGFLRGKYSMPIIGMEPAVKPAITDARGKRVLVTATPLTIKEDKLKRLIASQNAQDKVDLLPLPKLVGFAEKLEFVSPAAEGYLREKLSAFDLDRYSKVVLGCTHFNYFKDLFKAILPNDTQIIDGVGGTVKRLESVAGCENGGGQSKTVYFFSGRLVSDSENLKRLQKLHERLDIMERI